MLRLPPTTIELTRTDLDRHYRRSDARIDAKRHRSELIAQSESRRRCIARLEAARATANHPRAEERLSRAQPAREQEATTWEEVLIHRQSGPSETVASPSLPLPRVRHHQQSESEDSDSSVYTPGSGLSSDDDFCTRIVSDVINGNNESTTEEDDNSTLITRVEGNYDDDDDEFEASNLESEDLEDGGTPRPMAPHPTPVHDISSVLRFLPWPIPLPHRLRAISGTAPQLGSPLRYAEAIQQSSSPQRPTEAALAQLRSLWEHAPSTPRSESSQQLDSGGSPSRVHLDGQSTLQSWHHQLEVFSPASEDELQRFRNATRREAAVQPSYRMTLRLVTEEAAANIYDSTDVSVSRRHTLPATAETPLTIHGQSMGINDALDGVQDLPGQRTPHRSVRVYDDRRSSMSQPQTPVGLPRHGIPIDPSSPDATAPPPPQGAPRPRINQVRWLRGQPILHRRLEGERQQENVDDVQFVRQIRARLQQGEIDRRASPHVLETTPPSQGDRHARGR